MTVLGLLAGGLLLAGWVCYPIVLWVAVTVTGRRRPACADPPAWPNVEGIIATREGPEAVRRRVLDLLAADYPRECLHVTVALDASAAGATEDVAAALKDLPGVQVVASAGASGKAGALNAAVRAARAEVLVFSDTAQSFEPGTVPALVRCLGVPGVAGASGYLAAAGDRGALGGFWSYETTLRALESRWDSLVGLTGAVYALRREAWVPLRDGLINDDMMAALLVRRAGGRVVHCPEAVAVDPRRFTPVQQYARRVRTLTGIYQQLAWYPWLLAPIANPLWLELWCHKLIRLLTPLLILLVLGGAWPLMSPAGLAVAGVAAVGLVVVAAVGLRRSPRALALEGWHAIRLLLIAPVVAMAHALRGRWDVWTPARSPSRSGP